jgi:type I restriction enzyme S subunit
MTSRKGWPRVAFGDVVGLVRERSTHPASGGLKRYVGLEHLEPGEGNVADGTTFTNVFRAGQVLFGKRRAYLRKVAVADFDGVCSGDIYVLEPKDRRLLPELLPFVCQTDSFFQHAVGTSAGSLSPRTNWDSLASFEFALPPPEEQRRILAAVQGSTLVAGTLEKCLSTIRQLATSIRAWVFDPDKFGSVRLSNLAGDGDGIQIGPFGAQLHQSDYEAHGVPIVMPVNMRNDRIDPVGIARISEGKASSLAVHRLKEGDILLPRRGELDRRAIVTEDNAGWVCGTGSLRVRIDPPTPPRAILHALAAPHCLRWLEANAVGTTMPNLNSRIVGDIPISLPPPEVLAPSLVALEALDSGVEAMRRRIESAHQLRYQVLQVAMGIA